MDSENRLPSFDYRSGSASPFTDPNMQRERPKTYSVQRGSGPAETPL